MKRRMQVLLSLVVIVALVAGCGEAKSLNANQESEPLQQSSDETLVDGKENQDTEGEKTDEKGSAKEQEQEEKVNLDAQNKASQEAYEKFLNNEETLYFDQYNLPGQYNYEADKVENLFQEGTPYTLNEVMEVFEQEQRLDDEAFAMGSVKYTYLDCGKDGVSELALLFADYNVYDMPYNQIFVIKKIEDKLQLCFAYSYGYRTDGMLNEYGYFVSGGSSGAASRYFSHELVNGAGDYVFVYDETTCFSPFSISTTNEEMNLEAYEEIADFLEVIQYSFAAYSSYDSFGEEAYKEYIKNLKNVYHKVSVNGNPIEDEEIYKEDSLYAKFAKETGLSFYSDDEMEALLEKQKEEKGLTKEIEQGKDVTWTTLLEAPKIETVQIRVQNPGWEYYVWDSTLTEASSHSKLSLISKEDNEIIDEGKWFSDIGVAMPDRNDVTDGDYQFHMYGDDTGYYPYLLDISKESDSSYHVTLDFSEFYYPDEFDPEDSLYVQESIRSPKVVDDILYLSVFHTTYAQSAPHNGYLMALDMKHDFKVLWKSEPLTINSYNFEIVGDTIVCGYGFTAEPDYLYLVDRNTGKRVDTIKLKTGPDYFYAIGDKLYVRTYDTNYVFQMETK